MGDSEGRTDHLDERQIPFEHRSCRCEVEGELVVGPGGPVEDLGVGLWVLRVEEI